MIQRRAKREGCRYIESEDMKKKNWPAKSGSKLAAGAIPSTPHCQECVQLFLRVILASPLLMGIAVVCLRPTLWPISRWIERRLVGLPRECRLCYIGWLRGEGGRGERWRVHGCRAPILRREKTWREAVLTDNLGCVPSLILTINCNSGHRVFAFSLIGLVILCLASRAHWQGLHRPIHCCRKGRVTAMARRCHAGALPDVAGRTC